MIPFEFADYRIVLASGSPRRQLLLQKLNINFEVRTKEIKEIYPSHLKRGDIPLYLSRLKVKSFDGDMVDNNTIVIAADTIVWFNDMVLSKPGNREEAINMLKQLSGNMHEVYTGVCIRSGIKSVDFTEMSKVFFKSLTGEEILWYVDNFKPFDKAGAYGIQEWIGYIAIERIEGSYSNIMGLPTKILYEELKKFIEK